MLQPYPRAAEFPQRRSGRARDRADQGGDPRRAPDSRSARCAAARDNRRSTYQSPHERRPATLLAASSASIAAVGRIAELHIVAAERAAAAVGDAAHRRRTISAPLAGLIDDPAAELARLAEAQGEGAAGPRRRAKAKLAQRRSSSRTRRPEIVDRSAHAHRRLRARRSRRSRSRSGASARWSRDAAALRRTDRAWIRRSHTDHPGRSRRAGRRDDRAAQPHHPRQGAAAAAVPRLPARARSPADRGHSRRRQDDARARARRDRSASPISASSSPATCCRPTSSASRCSSARPATFRFHKGPVFAQLVLADEVNRATPKAQSALLEAMEEHQVTADGQTYPLAAPFFVIATQNPVYQIGTYPLPESQLDRFLMRIELGYPDAALERQLLLGQDRRDLLATLAPTLSPQQLLLMQTMVPARACLRCAARLRAGDRALHARVAAVRGRACRRARRSRCCAPRRPGR